MRQKRAPAATVHPVQGLSTLLRLSWLLLIPLIQRAIVRPESLWENLQSTLSTVLLTAIVLVCSWLQWRSTRFYTTRSRLLFRHGILRQEQQLLPFSQVDCVYITFSLLSSLFGAGLLELETAAVTRRPDCSVFLSHRRLRRVVERFLPEKSDRIFRAQTIPLLICAMSWSNAASGLLLAAPFVQKAGQVFGQEIPHLLLEKWNPRAALISAGVPPLAAAIGWILFLGWAAAFLRQVFTCSQFSCSIAGDFAVVRCGLLPRRLRLFRLRTMTAITVRQTLLMHLCGICSLLAHVPGDERQKDCRPLLVAAASQREAGSWLPAFEGNMRGEVLRPPKRAQRRYLFPVFCPLMITSLMMILLHLFSVPDFIGVLLFPLLIFFLWRALVRFAELPFALLEMDGENLRLCRMQGFSLLCTCVDKCNITGLQIRQSRAQKRAGLCSVDVFLRGKRARRCSVRHLDFAQVSRMLKRFPL